MPHIPAFGIKNFKVFKDEQYFTFNPITILTGTNSSGKSCLINALAISNSLFHNETLESILKLSVKNSGKKLGGFSNLIHRDNDADNTQLYPENEKSGFYHEIVFSLPTNFPGIIGKMTLNLTYRQEEKGLDSGVLNEVELLTEHKLSVFKLYDVTSGDFKIIINAKYLYECYLDELKRLKKYNTLRKKIIEDEHNARNYEKVKRDFEDSKGLMGLLYMSGATNLHTNKFNTQDKNYEVVKNMLEPLHPHFFYSGVFQNQYYDNYTSKIKENDYLPFEWNIDTNDPDLPIYNYCYFEGENSEPLKITEENWFKIDALLKYQKQIMDTGGIFNFFKKVEFDFFSSLENLNYELDYAGFDFAETEIDNKLKHFFTSILFDTLDPPQFFDTLDFPQQSLKYTDGFLTWEVNVDRKKFLIYDLINDGIIPKRSNPKTYFHDTFLGKGIEKTIKTALHNFSSQEVVYAQRSPSERIVAYTESEHSYFNLIKDFFEVGVNSNSKAMDFINKYLKRFKIGNELLIKHDKETGTSKIYISKNNRNVLLPDLGYGVSQILPVILKIAIHATKNYNSDYEFVFPKQQTNNTSHIIIEEPETNLHPALQSMLADMFVDAFNEFNMQFIIETHSEYLIRKLQYLTAKKNIEPDFTQIYYFYPPSEVPEGEKQVKKININANGSLTDDFGTGFFDESDKIAISLFNLQHSQNN
jgi:AAA15 family ATPase/GTPase